MRRPSTLSRGATQAPFLEPPHSHDMEAVPVIAVLPSSIMSQLPEKVQDSVWDLYESASIAYASYIRLQALLDERFARLMPELGPTGPRFSEQSFFNYRNHVQAEQTYLLSDALPDWRHKASIAKVALQPYETLKSDISSNPPPTSVAEWWSSFQLAVLIWLDDAKKIAIPVFEDTVQDYLSESSSGAVSDSEEPLSPGVPNEDHASLPSIGFADPVTHLQQTPKLSLPGRKDSAIYIED